MSEEYYTMQFSSGSYKPLLLKLLLDDFSCKKLSAFKFDMLLNSSYYHNHLYYLKVKFYNRLVFYNSNEDNLYLSLQLQYIEELK